MGKVKFTDEDLSWLEANCASMSLRDCGAHLNVSAETVQRTIKKLGFNIGGKKKPIKVVNIKNNSRVESEFYCINCMFYRKGGICGKNGRLTGALHQKKCFNGKE